MGKRRVPISQENPEKAKEDGHSRGKKRKR